MGQNPQVVAFIAELQHWRQVNEAYSPWVN
jgi:hypothetical protein